MFLSGGLGPTEDDLTRECVATALGRELLFQEELWRAIVDRFRRRGRPIAENNKRQAWLIDGAEALPNPNGTAAGQWIGLDGRAVVLLPGPPGELKPMFLNHCMHRLQRMLRRRPFVPASIV